jgi:hypothetical protein
LSSSLRNGSIMAPNNGPRNNSVKKRSIWYNIFRMQIQNNKW